MRLRRSTVSGPGIVRTRRGKGFSAVDLATRGLTRKRVVALALHLLDRGYFRAGGEQYAEDNESYGIATLRREHVSVRRNAVCFDYPAKSGVQRCIQIEDDPEVERAVRALLRQSGPSDRLLVCRDGDGWAEIRADDINAQFKLTVGEDYSVKDLRTWHGTVMAAAAFADAAAATSTRVAKRAESAVMKHVAGELGNTPAVARKSYVDPRVIQGYEAGVTIAAATRRASRTTAAEEVQAILEKATRTLIRRVSSGAAGKVSSNRRAS